MSELIVSAVVDTTVAASVRHFVALTCQNGTNWLAAKYQGHQDTAKKQAQVNTSVFVRHLGNCIAALEEKGELSQEIIEHALENPEFSVFLQNAMLAAAQTEDTGTHNILADLVGTRLCQPVESIWALTSKMAVEVIPYLSSRQLRLLALIRIVKRTQDLNLENMQVDLVCQSLDPFLDLYMPEMDYLHLEANGCISINIISRSHFKILSCNEFANTPSGKMLADLQDNYCFPSSRTTSVGYMLGTMVAAQLEGRVVSFQDLNI